MPRIQHCVITVDLANALRGVVDQLGLKVPNGDLGFLCPGCMQPVKPHDGPSAHFEHLVRNLRCPITTTDGARSLVELMEAGAWPGKGDGA